MADDINNLVLEHLRAVRADMRDMRDILREQGSRLTRIERGLAGLRRNRAADAEGVAEMGLRLDRLAGTGQHIEYRLDLVD
ncbi:hypothetical protein [Rhizobium sp. SGZ-381]|uniref:hypothetical protein n=1 Tax=Rhizobium sp. SGZ-381 TaxID=3342800 RepID=UPI00366E17BC